MTPPKAQLKPIPYDRGKAELEKALTDGMVIADKCSTKLRPDFARAVEEEGATGYPGLPGLTPAAGLSRMERLVEARFAQLIAEDPAGAVALYREIARKDFGSDRYLNADLALSLLPEYAADKEFRTVFHRATYGPVSYLTRLLVMPQILRENAGSHPYAMFLAGGPASGKTTVSKGALLGTLQVAAIIVDSNLATMSRGEEFLSAALEVGLRPQIVFVYTPWERVVNFVLGRLRSQGRPISAETLAGNHFEAQRTFLRLSLDYAGRADFVVLANEGRAHDFVEKPLEYLRDRTYASQGEIGSKDTLLTRFREHVVREWNHGNLTTVEALASGWSGVDAAGLSRLEEEGGRLREGAR